MQKNPEEIRFIFADMHLGEGKIKYEDGEEKINNLEFFEADEEFARTIDLALKRYKDRGADLTLCLNGDTFDFLTVEYTWEEVDSKGKIITKRRIKAEPKEDAAIQKVKKILSAHPLVASAFTKFLYYGKITFLRGNHDAPLAWANVQSMIRKILTKDIAPEKKWCMYKKIKFIDEETKNGTLFTHGNASEEQHATPKEIFIHSHFGKKLIPPLLNHPYGNHIVTDLANALSTDTLFCDGNPWIGRLEPHWPLYVKGIWSNWRFAIYAIFMWAITPLRHFLTRRWWVKKNTNLFKLFTYNFQAMVATIWNTIRGKDFTEYAKKVLKENKNIDMVFLGHAHNKYHCETIEGHGTYYYTGNWCVSYSTNWPKIELKWKRFKWLEKIIKNLFAAKKFCCKKTAHLYEPKKREIYSFGVCKFYGNGYKEASILKLNKEKNDLEKVY